MNQQQIRAKYPGGVLKQRNGNSQKDMQDLGFVYNSQGRQDGRPSQQDEARTSKYPLYKAMVDEKNPVYEVKKQRDCVANKKCSLLKPLLIERDKSPLNPTSYDALVFFKDVLLMLLDLCIDPDLATTHNSLIETLLQVFCELLEDDAIFSKTKESQSKESTTIPFILKLFLASTQ